MEALCTLLYVINYSNHLQLIMISCPTFAFMWGPLRLRGSTGWGGESREVFPTWNFVPNIVVNLLHLSRICQLHSEGDCRRGDGEWWGRLWKQLVGWGQSEKHTLYLFPKFNNFSIRFHMGVKKTRRLDQSYLHLRGGHTNRLWGGIWGNSQMSTTDSRIKWALSLWKVGEHRLFSSTVNIHQKQPAW